MNPSFLNPSQLDAVHADSPLMIVAGPGTGKTRTLAHKFVYLVKEKNIDPARILTVTFTKSAAREMKERLCAMLAPFNERDFWVDTFHAIAFRILKQEGYPFGTGVEFGLISDQRKEEFLRRYIERSKRSVFLDAVRSLKQKLQSPDGADSQIAMYQKYLMNNRLLDFDDLLVFANRLLDQEPAIRQKYSELFLEVLVDEFQDTSFAQYKLMRQLSQENLCVAGDPDQSIYGFGTLAFSAFDQFKEDFPKAKVCVLKDNYRSKALIVKGASQVIAGNASCYPRELKAAVQGGLPIEIEGFQSDKQEAQMIIKRIEGLLGGSSFYSLDSRWAIQEKENSVYALEDIAIFYRLNAQARLIASALDSAGLPYRIFGKTIPGGNLDDRDELEEYMSSEDASPLPLSQRGRWITLMSLHRSKGLEFPIVFIAGCEEGLLPYKRFRELSLSDREIEEERRLFYVGMTRAKERLFLIYAKKRFLFGQCMRNHSSRFIKDIEEALREFRESQYNPKKARSHTLQNLPF